MRPHETENLQNGDGHYYSEKQQPTDWEKIFINSTYNRTEIPKIHEDSKNPQYQENKQPN